MKKNNLDLILSELEKLNMTLGCYDEKINTLDNNNINKVVAAVKWESDTIVHINRKIFIVEIDIVDNEVDFNLLSKEEYISRYGSELFEEY